MFKESPELLLLLPMMGGEPVGGGPTRFPFSPAEMKRKYDLLRDPRQREKVRRAMKATADRLLLGEYVVELELGEGGMGKVLLVRDRVTKARFAVKTTRVLNSEATAPS